MLLTIVLLIAITTALAFRVLAPRMIVGRLVFDTTPDRPVPFGYQMAWLAIRTVETHRVVEHFELTNVEPANWSHGIGTIYHKDLGNGRIFVSPPVEGWTFVIGLSLPQPLGPSFTDKCTPLLLDTGTAFPEVHYYLCDPVTEMYAWAKVEAGRLKRAFAFGDDGVIWNKGRITPEELELGLGILTAPRSRRKGHLELVSERDLPTEAHVTYLAGRWSMDPTQLQGEAAQRGAGSIGFAPANWAPTRLRRVG
ncbi:MAG: hypothetical protein RLZ98_2662 [Pseudomonadota bacterium]